MPRVPGEQASPKSAGSEDPSHFLTWGVDTTGSEDGEDSRDANRLTEVCECRLSRHRHVLRLCERCADREISILLKAEKFGLDHHDSSQCEIKDFTCGREMKAVAPRRGPPLPVLRLRRHREAQELPKGAWTALAAVGPGLAPTMPVP